MGSQYAVAGSVNAHYKGGNLMLEAARYAFMPDNPAGADNKYVVMGAYDYPYLVASSGTLLIANLSWTFPVHLGVWKSVTVYNDFSYLLKDPAGYAPSGENDLGAAFSVGPMYCYMDFAFGKNHPWLGPEYTSAWPRGTRSVTGTCGSTSTSPGTSRRVGCRPLDRNAAPMRCRAPFVRPGGLADPGKPS